MGLNRSWKNRFMNLLNDLTCVCLQGDLTKSGTSVMNHSAQVAKGWRTIFVSILLNISVYELFSDKPCVLQIAIRTSLVNVWSDFMFFIFFPCQVPRCFFGMTDMTAEKSQWKQSEKLQVETHQIWDLGLMLRGAVVGVRLCEGGCLKSLIKRFKLSKHHFLRQIYWSIDLYMKYSLKSCIDQRNLIQMKDIR